VPASSSRPAFLIVGAGIIGCAVAESLTRAGHTVRVVDMRAPGQGATQASAGVLAPYIEGHEAGPLRSLGRRSLDLYDTYVRRVEAESGLPVRYARTGTLETALDEGHAARLRASQQALTAEGVAAEFLEGGALRAAEPAVSPAAVGALHVPLHGYVGVLDLTLALAAAAQKRGAVFTPGVQVARVTVGKDGLIVHTNAGIIHAGQVVLASGSWTRDVTLDGVSPIPVTPVRGQLLHLAAGDAVLRRVTWGADCYLVPWGDGTVLVGATVEHVGFDERATVPGVSGLLSAATRLVPALGGAAFSSVRVGLRPGSGDDLPLIGRSDVLPGLIYAVGHYRNGILLAPLTAGLVAALAGGGLEGIDPADPEFQAFAPSRVGRL
jgi:glycine oxidase